MHFGSIIITLGLSHIQTIFEGPRLNDEELLAGKKVLVLIRFGSELGTAAEGGHRGSRLLRLQQLLGSRPQALR